MPPLCRPIHTHTRSGILICYTHTHLLTYSPTHLLTHTLVFLYPSISLPRYHSTSLPSFLSSLLFPFSSLFSPLSPLSFSPLSSLLSSSLLSSSLLSSSLLSSLCPGDGCERWGLPGDVDDGGTDERHMEEGPPYAGESIACVVRTTHYSWYSTRHNIHDSVSAKYFIGILPH